MTELEAYRACLIELNKVLAPALLLDDFNYFFLKAIQKYFNLKYNIFEINLQITDDLRVLVRTKSLTKHSRGTEPSTDQAGPSIPYELPNDYVHILNCTCEFLKTGDKCNPNGSLIRIGANKLDSSLSSLIITNYYMKPSMSRPYYYISNIEDPDVASSIGVSIEDRESGTRYGNETIPIIEIKCGVLDTGYTLKNVYVDYLRAPKFVKLTKQQIDDSEDTTNKLEFPDYVIYEIINQIVVAVLENAMDQRQQTFLAVNTTIPSQAAQTN